MNKPTTEKLVLLDFFQEDCRQCQTMTPVLTQVLQRLGGSLELVQVDTTKNLPVAVAYQVGSVPTLILLKDGIVCWRKAGLISRRELEQAIGQHL